MNKRNNKPKNKNNKNILKINKYNKTIYKQEDEKTNTNKKCKTI